MATIALQHGYDAWPRGVRRIAGAVTGNAYTIDGLGRVVVDTRDAPAMLAGSWLYASLSDLPNEPLGGTSLIDFGAFPGTNFASVTVAAADIAVPAAVIDAWVTPIATVDHSADEHLMDPPLVVSAVISGSNIVITGVPSGRDLPVPPGTPFGNTANSQQPTGNRQFTPYGKWSVSWAFSP